MKKNKTKERRVDYLTGREHQILLFLWRWQAASYPTLKQAISSNTNNWNFYQNLNRLNKEGYIELHPGSTSTGKKYLLWTLTAKGFEYIREELGELKNESFRSEKFFHDKYALAFQLGNLIYNPNSGIDMYTHKEISSYPMGYYPAWVPQTNVHYPDGYTRLKDGNRNIIIAHEVEMHLKSKEHYEPAIDFYDDRSAITFVLWLVATPAIAERIESAFLSRKCRRRNSHHIFLIDDFEKHGWDASVHCGPQKSKKISELYHQYGYHIPANTPLIPQQLSFEEVFLRAIRSPVGLDSYRNKRKLLLANSTTHISSEKMPLVEIEKE